MAIIRLANRPALRVSGGDFGEAPADWLSLDAARDRLRRAIACVGKIVVDGHPYVTSAGSGLMVGPGRVVTARYIAQLFAEGSGENAALISGHTARLVRESSMGHMSDGTLALSAIRFLHPALNIAALEAPYTPGEANEWLVFATAAPPDLVGREVAVIGVAENDPRNPQGMPEIFGNDFGSLRVQPGRVLGVESDEMGATKLLHDCSTVGGSGGAPVVDLTTGEVLAIHVGGMFLVQNYAVPAWELARDPRVRCHGLRFADEPEWMPRWIDADLGAPTTPAPQVSRSMRHFSHLDALDLVDVLIAAGFASPDRQPGLFFGMDVEFVASLLTAGSPVDRLRMTVDILNRTPALITGEVPMETLLLNAVKQSRPLIESSELATYLERLQQSTASRRRPRG